MDTTAQTMLTDYRHRRHALVLAAAKSMDVGSADGADSFLIAGRSAMVLGDYKAAASHLEDAVDRDPWNGPAWAALGNAWYELRQFGRAGRAWHRAETLGPLDRAAQALRHASLFADGRCDLPFDEIANYISVAYISKRLPNLNFPEEQPRLPIFFNLGWAKRNSVCLTIDDGPHPDSTPVVLDALQSRGVSATFFVVGRSAEAYPHLVDMMLEQGHQVFNHTFSHRLMTSLDADEIIEEFERTEAVLSKHREMPTPYPLRLPGGMGWDNSVVHAAIGSWNENAILIHWSTGTRDHLSPQTFRTDDEIRKEAKCRAAEVLLDELFPGAIILLHECLYGMRRFHPHFLHGQYCELLDAIKHVGSQTVSLEF
jgi:peptidoglycan/xylan/chitin deacetylase (PgdA/CDA1 family)